MSAQESVTHWIDRVKAGEDSEAQEQLWSRYFQRLVSVARQRLKSAPRRAKDEEDVALSVMESLFRGAAEGRFPELRDRTNLWPLLVKMTARKSINQIRDERALKRGGGAVRGESVFAGRTDAEWQGGIQQIVGSEPSPEFAAQVSEQVEKLLDQLGDETLRSIAELKLEGFTNPEISDRLGRPLRTVERKLEMIRRCWQDSLED